jgi:endoribonuclease LACTB2
MNEEIEGLFRVCPGVQVVPVRSPTLPPATHTNVWILGEHHVTIVDPACPEEDEQERLDSILEMFMVERILLTHHHQDHIGGALAIKRTTGAKIAAHPATRDLLGFEVDELLDEGDGVATDSGAWRVLHTPGHAPGHIVLFNGGLSAMVAGDMVAGEGTILLDPPEGVLSQYLASLERMRDLKPSLLLPAHGPAITDGTTCLQHYIDHRHMRTEQIIAALAAQPGMSAAVIASQIYATLIPAEFLPVATRQVLAHLHWLEAQGRAVNIDGSFHVVNG